MCVVMRFCSLSCVWKSRLVEDEPNSRRTALQSVNQREWMTGFGDTGG